MDELTSKQALLDTIRLSEGDTFKCDEKAFLEEYTTRGENKSSLAIKVLSILGGFLATLSGLGFLALAGLYDSKQGLLVVGIIFIVAAIWLNREYNKLIIDTFSISIYMSGFALLALGLTETDVDTNNIILLISSIAFVSMFITQNFILSFLSFLTISGGFLLLIITNDAYDLIHLYTAVSTLLLTYFFLNEAKIISSSKKLSKLYNPIKIGLIFSLLFGLIILVKRDLIQIQLNEIWLSSIVIILVMLYIIHIIIKINEVKTITNKVLIYALSSVVLLSTLYSPSISGAIVIILLSFLVNYKTGLTIGIISLIYFISQYYYDLNFTLLTKSIILFASGVVFLLLYLFTTKILDTNEKI